MGPHREIRSSMQAVRSCLQLSFGAQLLLENMPFLLESACGMTRVCLECDSTPLSGSCEV